MSLLQRAASSLRARILTMKSSVEVVLQRSQMDRKFYMYSIKWSWVICGQLRRLISALVVIGVVSLLPWDTNPHTFLCPADELQYVEAGLRGDQ